MYLFNNIPEIKYSYKNLITYSNNSSLDQSNIMNKFSKNKIITMSIDNSNKFNLRDIYHKVNVMCISTNEILFNIDPHCDINAFGLKAITNLFN